MFRLFPMHMVDLLYFLMPFFLFKQYQLCHGVCLSGILYYAVRNLVCDFWHSRDYNFYLMDQVMFYIQTKLQCTTEKNNNI